MRVSDRSRLWAAIPPPWKQDRKIEPQGRNRKVLVEANYLYRHAHQKHWAAMAAGNRMKGSGTPEDPQSVDQGYAEPAVEGVVRFDGDVL